MNLIPTQDIFPGIRFNANTWRTLPDPFAIRMRFLTRTIQYNCEVLRNSDGEHIGNRFVTNDVKARFTFKVCLDQMEKFFIHGTHSIINENVSPEPSFSALLLASTNIPFEDNKKWFNAYNAYITGWDFNEYYATEIHSAVFMYESSDANRKVLMTIEKISIDWFRSKPPIIRVDPDKIMITQTFIRPNARGSRIGVPLSDLTHMFPGGIVIDNGRFQFADEVDRVVFETDHLGDVG